MKKRFILFDIDNTLYDTSALRAKLFERVAHVMHEHNLGEFASLCEKVYKDSVARTGIFYPEDLVKGLEEALPNKEIPSEKLLDAMYDEKLLTPHLYDEAHEIVERFEKMGDIGLFSQGMERFQKLKIKKIAHYFLDHHTFIVTSKLNNIEKVFEMYKDYEVIFLDDALPVLHAVKKAYPDVVTIWIKRGRHALSQQPIDGFTPDATVLTLTQAESVISNV